MRVIDLRDPAPERGARAHFPWAVFVLLNALNLADGVLTKVAIGSGVATEANPIAGALGLTGKLVLVAVAGYALARLRPAALWIPIVALGAVVVWTAAGMVIAGSSPV